MSVTKRYMHLAGVVFRDEAEKLERRMGIVARELVERCKPLRLQPTQA
jgi:hypothetical protein